MSDQSPPSVGFTGGGLASRAWVRGNQSAIFRAGDNSGIRGAALSVDGAVRNPPPGYPCDFARPIPCQNKSGASLGFDTARRLTDGLHRLNLRVVDSAGNARDAATSLFVDNTAPGRVPIGVAAGEGWRRLPSFRLGWINAEPHAPVSALRYVLCKVGGRCLPGVRVGARTAAEVHVPGPGDWRMLAWREDAAGNQDSNSADARHLRYDPDPPRVAFERQSDADPLRVTARVSDGASGIGGGQIEMRLRGSATWHELGARLESGRLVARVDDERFPDGLYDLRARAVDHAGNEASTDRGPRGQAATFALPARVVIRMRAGLRRRVRGRRGGRRRGVRLLRRARVRYRRSVTIRGSLANRDGQPLGHAALDVLSQARTPGTPMTLVGQTRTNSRGQFRYRARASQSRTLRFAYGGSRKLRSISRDVHLLVPASTSFRVAPRRVFNGGIIRLSGRVRGGSIPPGGKLLHLEARYRGAWRTFQVVRTDSRGSWSSNYTFGASTGRVIYPFRAVMPFEAVFPFERGRSRTVKVSVVGQ